MPVNRDSSRPIVPADVMRPVRSDRGKNLSLGCYEVTSSVKAGQRLDRAGRYQKRQAVPYKPPSRDAGTRGGYPSRKRVQLGVAMHDAARGSLVWVLLDVPADSDTGANPR